MLSKNVNTKTVPQRIKAAALFSLQLIVGLLFVIANNLIGFVVEVYSCVAALLSRYVAYAIVAAVAVAIFAVVYSLIAQHLGILFVLPIRFV